MLNRLYVKYTIDFMLQESDESGIRRVLINNIEPNEVTKPDKIVQYPNNEIKTSKVIVIVIIIINKYKI